MKFRKKKKSNDAPADRLPTDKKPRWRRLLPASQKLIILVPLLIFLGSLIFFLGFETLALYLWSRQEPGAPLMSAGRQSPAPKSLSLKELETSHNLNRFERLAWQSLVSTSKDLARHLKAGHHREDMEASLKTRGQTRDGWQASWLLNGAGTLLTSAGAEAPTDQTRAWLVTAAKQGSKPDQLLALEKHLAAYREAARRNNQPVVFQKSAGGILNLTQVFSAGGSSYALIQQYSEAEYYGNFRRARLLLPLVALLASLILTLLAHILLTKMLRPLRWIRRNLSAAARGEVRLSAVYPSPNELGDLFHSLDNTFLNLRQQTGRQKGRWESRWQNRENHALAAPLFRGISGPAVPGLEISAFPAQPPESSPSDCFYCVSRNPDWSLFFLGHLSDESAQVLVEKNRLLAGLEALGESGAGADIAEAASRVNHWIQANHPPGLGGVWVVLDNASGEFIYCSAQSGNPLVLHPDGSIQKLISDYPVFPTHRDRGAATTEGRLESGQTLFLHLGHFLDSGNNEDENPTGSDEGEGELARHYLWDVYRALARHPEKTPVTSRAILKGWLTLVARRNQKQLAGLKGALVVIHRVG